MQAVTSLGWSKDGMIFPSTPGPKALALHSQHAACERACSLSADMSH